MPTFQYQSFPRNLQWFPLPLKSSPNLPRTFIFSGATVTPRRQKLVLGRRRKAVFTSLIDKRSENSVKMKIMLCDPLSRQNQLSYIRET